MKGAQNNHAPTCIPTRHVVYIFAGASLRNDVADWLHSREAELRINVLIAEVSAHIFLRIEDCVLCAILAPPPHALPGAEFAPPVAEGLDRYEMWHIRFGTLGSRAPARSPRSQGTLSSTCPSSWQGQPRRKAPAS